MTDRTFTSTDGQPLGKRGLRTRQRILEVIADLIEQHGLRGLKLADVAEQVGFSPPAFYQYFHDMDEAILALCEDVSVQIPPFAFPSAAEGPDEGALEGSRPFVESFLQYWDDHRAVLWSRNVAVYEGDARFRDIRDQAFQPIVEALMSWITVAQREGRVDPSLAPRALATPLVVMLDRIGMLTPAVVEPWGSTSEELVDAVAYIVDRVLGIEAVAPARSARARSGASSRRGAAAARSAGARARS